MPSRSAVANEPGPDACDRLGRVLERALTLETMSRTVSTGADPVYVPLAQYCLSILHMRLRPALEPGWTQTDPVHVAMFGGTNSGKSTVLNLLLGRPGAAMSGRARFSQHPEAFRIAALGNRFLDAYTTRFAGYQRYQDRHPPRQEDDDLTRDGYRRALAVFDPSHLPGLPIASPATRSAVFWDLPDFSTEEAQRYLCAVFDTIALADLVVMTVTRENYADHRGALLRAMVIESGVPLRVVANKIEPGSALLADIQLKLGSGMEPGPVSADRFCSLPQLNCADELDCLTSLLSTPEAHTLRQAVAEDVSHGPALKRAAAFRAVTFLENRLNDALAPLWTEVGRTQRWHEIVDRTARCEFYDRYRALYLDGEKYVEFNHTLVKLMDMLEIPGVGAVISGVSKGIKAVSRFLIGTVARGLRGIFGGSRGSESRGPELDVVAESFERWIDAIRGETQMLAEHDNSAAWREILRRLDSAEFLNAYGDALGAAYQSYRARMDRITSERAEALYELIARKPALLNTLRGVKVTLDVGTTALIVSSGGLNWTDAVIGPLVAPMQRLILEFGLDQYMAAQKFRLKSDQFAALCEVVDARMVAPVRTLYRGELDQQRLIEARSDLATIKTELHRALGDNPP